MYQNGDNMCNNMIKFQFDERVPYYYIVVRGEVNNKIFIVVPQNYNEGVAKALSDHILSCFSHRQTRFLFHKKTRIWKKHLRRLAKTIKLIQGGMTYGCV